MFVVMHFDWLKMPLYTKAFKCDGRGETAKSAQGYSSSSSSAALQPGVGFGLLYKVIPPLSISNQLLPVLHLHRDIQILEIATKGFSRYREGVKLRFEQV